MFTNKNIKGLNILNWTVDSAKAIAFNVQISMTMDKGEGAWRSDTRSYVEALYGFF